MPEEIQSQQTSAQSPSQNVVPESQSDNQAEHRTKIRIAMVGFALFFVFVIGLFWLATTPQQTVGLTLSFAAGLSMIFLPCTLPLAFVIVPLTLGKNPKKGLFMALSFTLGLTITLSLYGVFIAAAGKAFGLKSDAEVYAVLLGGTAAFLFGLSEIGLLKFRLPSYSGKFPDFIQRQKDYVKTFLLGLLLGNAGVGCPNPAFYVLLGYIATTGDIFNGWFLGFVHGMGRSVPLIFLAILGTLGVNALAPVVKHKETIARAMGWMLLIVGAYLLTFGIFGHDWFIASGTHSSWEQFVNNIGGERFGEIVLEHEHPLIDASGFIRYGNMFFLGLLAVTMLTAFIVKRPSRRTIKWLVAVYMGLALIIGYSTGWTFTLGRNMQGHGKEAAEAGHEHGDMMDTRDMPSAASLAALPLRGPSNRLERLPFSVSPDGYKEFRLEASEFRWEYADGKWVHVWGYNGQVPGPEIRANEGDKVRVIVKNSLPDATTIHWHGLDVPWQMDGVAGVTQKAIEPGATFTYEFVATPAGTRFYHSHGKDHSTAAQQMDMGLSGAFIVAPDYGDIDIDSLREYTLVLDEWDIQAGGVNSAISHMHDTGMMGAVPDFNTFTINGRIFPYVPKLDIKKGESVLVRFINAGTAAFHPMHLHGHSFKVVARDGFLLEHPEERNTITVNPGETVDISVEGNNPGPWLLHCHHVHHAAAGMITLLQYEGYEPIQSLK
ncbi:MAG: multicopper oxidase domain-containing protein [bacterium]|nr:multicopper oxidase domain-containing protein [bacterium]MDZ4284203.1 multicopper oxidase domain-containing protein [Patescibacteria group bacterium]